MKALGVIDLINDAAPFHSEPVQPVQPSGQRAFGEVVQHGRSPRGSQAEDLDVIYAQSLSLMLENARSAVERVRSSTTLARLSLGLEASGIREEAVDAASEVLEISTGQNSSRLLDASAVRLALEVLVRLGRVEPAIKYVLGDRVDDASRLMIATYLAGCDRLAEARQVLSAVESGDKRPILAFLLLSEGKDREAVPLLRSALRSRPADADSAYNLSVAFLRLGQVRKALAAAQRATRAAPGRKDVFLQYAKILLGESAFEIVLSELNRLDSEGIEESAELEVIRGRALLGLGRIKDAERVLSFAASLARRDGDRGLFAEISGNLIRLRVVGGKLDRSVAIKQLDKMHVEYSDSGAVLTNLAQVVEKRSDAKVLRAAYARNEAELGESMSAFVEFQIATLEGNNDRAADCARRWYELEPEDPRSASAALVALGIGTERWEDAAEIALRVVNTPDFDPGLLNNAAYVLAMSGSAGLAIRLIEESQSNDPILKATLGLAYLADGDVEAGMKLYREAADSAGDRGTSFRSLMTAYQALIVRQLGILDRGSSLKVAALALPPVDLPDDWEQRPEFIRLHAIVMRNGYPWPPTL